MGYAISWIAIKGKSKENILKFFSFSETADTEEVPESEISAAELPSGWYLIWFNQFESPFTHAAVVSKLSQDCAVITCAVEEHVMYSRTEYWEHGSQTWKITHDSQNGIYDIQTTGTAPDFFESLKSEVCARQQAEGGEDADIDLIFDIPLEVVKHLTFFKHDELTPELEDQEYRVLASSLPTLQSPASKPWWKFW